MYMTVLPKEGTNVLSGIAVVLMVIKVHRANLAAGGFLLERR